MHQHRTVEDTVYFWFAANDTSGSGGDGASPVYDVRLAGAAAGAAPVLSGSATLLTHAGYPDGCHEVAVAATTGNGFAAGSTYGVFCTLLVDSQNPAGFAGSFSLEPIIADVQELVGGAQSAVDLKDFTDDGYDPATNKVQGVVLVDTTTTNTDMIAVADVWAVDATGQQTQGTFGQAIGDPGATAKSLWQAIVSDAAGVSVSADVIAVKAETALIVADTNELQTDWADAGRLDTILDARMAEASINTTGGAVDLVTTTTTATNLTTNNDKAGYALSAAGVDAIWDEPMAGHTTADTAGLVMNDWQDAGRLDTILDTIATDTTTDIPALIAALNDVSTAEVLTQVNAALDTVIAELEVAAPTGTPTLRTGLMLLYMALRNKLVVQTSAVDAIEIYNDAGTLICKKAITDDTADYTEAEMSSG